MNRIDLERQPKITHYALGQLTHGKDVSSNVLEKICVALDYTIDDIMEPIPDQEGMK